METKAIVVRRQITWILVIGSLLAGLSCSREGAVGSHPDTDGVSTGDNPDGGSSAETSPVNSTPTVPGTSEGNAGTSEPPGADSTGTPDTPSTLPPAGNPDGRCPVPVEAQARSTASPTTVVGQGTVTSCSFAALAAAVAKGGVITFNCGPAVVTIPVTATLGLPTNRDTVIDGGGRITLDGRGAVRILEWNSPGWMTNTNALTLQHLTLINGKATGTEAIPQRPEPCSQGFNDGEGGALYMRDGVLHVIDVTFANNQAAELGPDTGGGAIYLLGCKPASIVSSTFKNNHASNAGAMGSLFAENAIYNSLYDGNSAVGHGANNDDPSQCAFINNGQHEVGSGGNGGAIYSDGVAVGITICGTKIVNNKANEFGAAIFFTSNDSSQKGSLKIQDSTLIHNVGNGVWEAEPGISTNGNFPTPVNTTINP